MPLNVVLWLLKSMVNVTEVLSVSAIPTVHSYFLNLPTTSKMLDVFLVWGGVQAFLIKGFWFAVLVGSLWIHLPSPVHLISGKFLFSFIIIFHCKTIFIFFDYALNHTYLTHIRLLNCIWDIGRYLVEKDWFLLVIAARNRLQGSARNFRLKTLYE